MTLWENFKFIKNALVEFIIIVTIIIVIIILSYNHVRRLSHNDDVFTGKFAW